MGKLAGQGRSLEVGMEKSIHAERGDFVEIGCAGGLKRGPVVKLGVAPITKAIEKQKNTAHARSSEKSDKFAGYTLFLSGVPGWAPA
jgi:hypothetical protein